MRVLICGLLFLVLLEAVFAVPSCPHGPAYIDECENECVCDAQAGYYACTRRGCIGDSQAEKPMYCEVDGEIRIESSRRLFCEGNIVRFEPSKKQICDGSPECPADCGQEWDETAGCYNCKCGPDLEFGDVTVAAEKPCPAGLVEGPNHLFQKVCKAQGCQPGATWTDSRGCSTCVCTEDAEPACTPCKREASESTRTCEDGFPSCPEDCGQVYDPEEDCYRCPCGVGEEGDVTAQFDEPCPPGTDFRTAGAFFKACAPFDKLPQGDTKFCGEEYREECPADCGLVRVGENEGCIFCQCGPELKAGDVEVAIEEECPGDLVQGPSAFVTKTCRQPTQHSCKPGTTFNEECNICLCQEDGTAACTKRDCSLEKYGDVRSCGEYRECPADCGQVGSDSYCTYCQCGPRLEPGEVTVTADEPCPPGLKEKEYQAFTKTCAPSSCQHGQIFIDECNNNCECIDGSYACTRRGCLPGQTSLKPRTCTGPGDLPKRPNARVICHEGIVKLQGLDEPCLEGSTFMDAEDCNSCFCSSSGVAGCTLKACVTLPFP